MRLSQSDTESESVGIESGTKGKAGEEIARLGGHIGASLVAASQSEIEFR